MHFPLSITYPLGKFRLKMISVAYLVQLVIISILQESSSQNINLTLKHRHQKDLFEDLLNFNHPGPGYTLYTLLASYVLLQQLRQGQASPPSNYLPCGTIREINPNEEFRISSTNSVTQPPSLCTWKLRFPRCTLKIVCPEFSLRGSQCFDYLEVRDRDGHAKRYCGENGPTISLSKETEINFRTNDKSLSSFRCNLRCDTPDPLQPLNAVPSSSCACGERPSNSKIVNGVEAEVGEFPWMALLVYKFGSLPVCGGTLINDRYILTAAHCVDKWTSSEFYEVLLNEHNTLVDDETLRPTQIFQIEATIIHELYNSATMDYDIALVKLQKPINLSDNDFIVPICLPRSLTDKYEGKLATAAGWGQTATVDISLTLQKVDLNIVTNEECMKAHSPRYVITPRMICAYADEKDTCGNDSGGPLIIRDHSTRHGMSNGSNLNLTEQKSILKYIQIGIVSFGDEVCASPVPGVYVRVTEFVDWILSSTMDASFCKA